MLGTPERIPYESWINSQLSLALFYGSIKFNGTTYFVDGRNNDLVRADIAKKEAKERREISAAKEREALARQGKLFNDNKW